MPSLIFSENDKKKFRMSSATILLSTLRAEKGMQDGLGFPYQGSNFPVIHSSVNICILQTLMMYSLDSN